MRKNLNPHLRILLKSSLFIFLIACATTFEKTENNIASIDSEYGSSIQDYRLGLKYFDKYARDSPMNQIELEGAIGKLKILYNSEIDLESKELIQFRINAFEAERLYKLASRGPEATYDSVVRCSKKEEVLNSIEELKKAVNNFEKAGDLYEKNSWEFMPSNWIERVRESDSILLARAIDQEKVVNKYCTAE